MKVFYIEIVNLIRCPASGITDLQDEYNNDDPPSDPVNYLVNLAKLPVRIAVQ